MRTTDTGQNRVTICGHVRNLPRAQAHVATWRIRDAARQRRQRADNPTPPEVASDRDLARFGAAGALTTPLLDALRVDPARGFTDGASLVRALRANGFLLDALTTLRPTGTTTRDARTFRQHFAVDGGGTGWADIEPATGRILDAATFAS